MDKGLRTKIIELSNTGKGRNEIAKELGCSKSVVSYHLNTSTKEKALQAQRVRRLDPTDRARVSKKIDNFMTQLKRKGKDFCKGTDDCIKLSDVMEKIGDDPKCALSGRKIDLGNPKAYSFDHIIPLSKGGQSTLDNMALTCTEANVAKGALLTPELLELCKDILTHHGYVVKGA
jgi:5-methylcytosine-specific restriction endonuclease McrA